MNNWGYTLVLRLKLVKVYQYSHTEFISPCYVHVDLSLCYFFSAIHNLIRILKDSQEFQVLFSSSENFSFQDHSQKFSKIPNFS